MGVWRKRLTRRRDAIRARFGHGSRLTIPNQSPRSESMVPALAIALLLVNLWTLWRYGQDKARAIEGRRRIPESELLWLAAIGGTPGAYAARRLFRHKTRKQPFSTYLALIAVAQAGVMIGLAWPISN